MLRHPEEEKKEKRKIASFTFIQLKIQNISYQACAPIGETYGVDLAKWPGISAQKELAGSATKDISVSVLADPAEVPI